MTKLSYSSQISNVFGGVSVCQRRLGGADPSLEEQLALTNNS